MPVTINEGKSSRYAKAQGAWMISNYKTSEGEDTCEWWLRSPGYVQNNPAYVRAEGYLYHINVNDASVCVRPALWVNLESGI